jgi:predicted neutral ceramidase superfamily lipid hydrolase
LFQINHSIIGQPWHTVGTSIANVRKSFLETSINLGILELNHSGYLARVLSIIFLTIYFSLFDQKIFYQKSEKNRKFNPLADCCSYQQGVDI